jgi:hypothetical protein
MSHPFDNPDLTPEQLDPITTKMATETEELANMIRLMLHQHHHSIQLAVIADIFSIWLLGWPEEARASRREWFDELVADLTKINAQTLYATTGGKHPEDQ